MTDVLIKYWKVKQEGTLHVVPFTTVFEYMLYLRELSLLLEPIGPKAVVYLAAAVSDFYIHPSNMVGSSGTWVGYLSIWCNNTIPYGVNTIPYGIYLIVEWWSGGSESVETSPCVITASLIPSLGLCKSCWSNFRYIAKKN